jgi:hypothetical protein
MAEFGVQIYGEHESFLCGFWSKEEWQKKLREVVPTPEAWMGMTIGKKKTASNPMMERDYSAIATIFGVEGNPIWE